MEAASDGKLWELWLTLVPSNENIDSYIGKALDDLKKGIAYPFVVVDINSRELIGTTRLLVCAVFFNAFRTSIPTPNEPLRVGEYQKNIC